MELLQGEEVIWEGHPTWRSTLLFYAKGLAIALIPIVIVVGLSALDVGTGLAVWQWVLIALLIAAGTFVLDTLRRSATLYTVTSRRLHIRRGILTRREQSTNIDRVQNVNTAQGPLERVLNVGSIDFDTAGSGAAEANFTFSGVHDPHGIVARIQPHFARLEGRAV